MSHLRVGRTSDIEKVVRWCRRSRAAAIAAHYNGDVRDTVAIHLGAALVADNAAARRRYLGYSVFYAAARQAAMLRGGLPNGAVASVAWLNEVLRCAP